MSDIDTLARTAFGEARNQGKRGMQAVCNVVMNRVALSDHHPHFGDGTVAGACLAPKQFSCWNFGDPNLRIITDAAMSDPVFADATWLASDAVNGLLEDITGGATYYKVRGTYAAWAEDKDPCALIGAHEFYKDIA